jgi:enoyl-CoA hydratase
MPKIDYSRYTENLIVEVKDHVMRLTLNNPEALNSTTYAMHWSLSRIWEDIHDDPEVRLVILTGAGRAFSAGGGVKMMQSFIDHRHLWYETVTEARRIVLGMLGCEKPIIARVNGHAIGFGATLALASDIIVADERARFADPHVSVSMVAGDGGALFWPQAIGYPRAKEFLLTGEQITAKEAVAMGLINHAVPAEELDAKVNAIAAKLVNGAQKAIRWTKRTLNQPLLAQAQSQLDVGLFTESLSVRDTEDLPEAVAAFREKRPPVFKGDD